ncbi:dehydrogenase [Ahniella affigens]|uniref:Dehydrogenase n=1 Tax=Ahniella affigens TaxID=2021234 RepID=A0A2P1PR45_9GAMM|nr:SDR family oxidoreductase [Ahniella affigens]AVP97323.1 dehydrogenase [Ahniella affigens]
MTQTALITGASAGIGAEFARQLAASGHDLILTARRLDRLQAVANELSSQHGIRVHCIAADLAVPADVERLLADVLQLGWPVDLFVQNAGYGLPGRFHSEPMATHRQFIEVMMTSPLALIHGLLPGMRARGRGRIINIASLAGFMPGSDGHTLYGACKAFWVKVSESLSQENRSHGVRVLALCPGFTYSEFHDSNGSRPLVSKMPKWLWMQAKDVVREGLKAIEQDRIVYINGWHNRLIKAVVTTMPDRLARAFSARQSRRFRITKD